MSEPLAVVGNGTAATRFAGEVMKRARPLQRGRKRVKRRWRTSWGATMIGVVRA